MSPSRRRILFVISTLSAGGAERVISELANALAEEYQVGVLTLASPTSDHYALASGVERISLNLIWDSKSVLQGLYSNLKRSWMIRQAAKSFKPDLVVSFIEQTNVRVLIALFGSGLPVIVSVRTDPRRHCEGLLWELARRLLYPLAANIVVQTEGVAEWARGFTTQERVRVIPNFVRSLPSARGELRLSNALLAVGRLNNEKGFDILIRAFAVSRLCTQGVVLTILGDGPERATLKRLADSLSVGGAVQFPGVVTEPECWMAQATVFVLPSRYEGFPNALLEAMAMGCAIIAADCDSGPREIVRHGIDGILVPPEDVDALAAALVNLVHNEALRQRLGKAAPQVRERFAQKCILKKWQCLIEGSVNE